MTELFEKISKLNNELEKETPKSLEEIENKITNAQTEGFLGNIPDFITQKIPKDKSIDDFLHVFNDFVELLKNNSVEKAENLLNNFFNNTIFFKAFKKHYEGLHIDFGVILENNVNSEKLFLKVFKTDYKNANIFHFRNGPFVEPAVALFVNSHLENFNNFARFYFANSLKLYMLLEYVDSVYDYSGGFEEKKREVLNMPNFNEITASEFFENAMAEITGEKFNHHKVLHSMKGGNFRHLDYQPNNFLICEDEFGQKHCKMIDYGYFIKY